MDQHSKKFLLATLAFSSGLSIIASYGVLRYFPEILRAPAPAPAQTETASVQTSWTGNAIASVQAGVKDVAEKLGPSVVSIVISKDVAVYRTDPFGFFYQPSGQTVRRKVGGGTGFFVRPDGFILTNKHVVSDPQASYAVILSNGEELEGKVLATDPTTDLAIVRAFKKNGKPYDSAVPVVFVPRTSEIEVGTMVVAIGNALAEFRNTLTFGVVSGLGRSIEANESGGQSEQLSGLVQTDTAINPGNSGGPLSDLSGRVIGVNTAVTQGANGIGFAIPLSSKIADGILESVIKYGEIKRSFLGIRYSTLTPSLAEEYGIPKVSGALVSSSDSAPAVVAGSPADKAGIKDGDIISEVDGKPLSSAFGVKEALAEKFPGERVTFKLYRKSSSGTFEPLVAEAQLTDR